VYGFGAASPPSAGKPAHYNCGHKKGRFCKKAAVPK
jgi:hypothetical protein